jgi:hypothetical protein
MINLLDTIITLAEEQNLKIRYIAFSPLRMKELVAEAVAFSGKDFKVDTLSMYKDIPLKTKEIIGFQVSFETEDDRPF